MKRFAYFSPTNLSEALQIMQAHPEALPLAGGTNLIVQIKEGQRSVEALLGLRRIPELRQVETAGEFSFGSLTSIAYLAGDPQVQQRLTALWEGAGWLGSVQTRNLATLGGNLCNASPAGDTLPALLALGAHGMAVSVGARRDIPLEDFFQGPGLTNLRQAELLQAVRIPPQPKGAASGYLRFTPRGRMDVAVASAAACLGLDGRGRINLVRLAAGAVAPTPVRLRQVEQLILGELPGPQLFRQAARLAAQECDPLDDLRASAAYRRHLLSVLVERLLPLVAARCRENGAGKEGSG